MVEAVPYRAFYFYTAHTLIIHLSGYFSILIVYLYESFVNKVFLICYFEIYQIHYNMKTQKGLSTKIAAVCSLMLIITACNGKKQSVEDAGPTEMAKQSVIIETDRLNPGVRYAEKRAVDPSQPPVVLDFTKKLPVTDLSLKDYYSNATSATLRHPFPSEKGGFLYDASIVVRYDQGMSSSGGVSTHVQVNDDYILTNDIFGALIFDRNGNLIDSTALTPIKGARYDSKKQELEFETKNRIALKNGLALENGGRYRYLEKDTVLDILKMCWKDIRDGSISEEIRFMEKPHATYLTEINDSTLLALNGNFRSSVLMTTFDKSSYDTLCVFNNYNQPTIKLTGPYSFPEQNWFYKNKDHCYFRQAFNDTIFRFTAANRIEPAYVLQFGDKRTDINTGLKGDKANKMIAYKWLDTDKFILFVYSQNYDCPNTRNNNSIFYHYALYDKTKKQLFNLPGDNTYPDEYLIPADIPGGIPLILDKLTVQDNKLISSYTKRTLESMQKMKAFSRLPADQQERVRQLAGTLADNEMIVMTLE